MYLKQSKPWTNSFIIKYQKISPTSEYTGKTWHSELKKFICQSRHQCYRLSSSVCRPGNAITDVNDERTQLWVVLPATSGRSLDKDLVKTRGKDYKLLDILLLMVQNSWWTKNNSSKFKTIWFLRDVSQHSLVVFGSQNIGSLRLLTFLSVPKQ